MPIREAWRARRTTAATLRTLGLSETRGTCGTIERLERDKAKLIEERDRWKRRSEHLEKELEAARRAGRRQAAPFAKDRPQGSGRRPGRRAGAEYGKHGCRRPPTRVDETYSAPAPTACPDCGGAVALDRVAAQYQEDLPDVRPLVRRFDIGVGHCQRCRRRVQGRHALQTSDALGAATAQLGPNVAALAVELHTELGMPLEKVTRVLRNEFGLPVTKGGAGPTVESRGGAYPVGSRWLVRRFRTGPQSEPRGHVSSPRSPNPACRFPAPGSPVESCGSHTGFPVTASGRVSRAVAPSSHPCAGRPVRRQTC